MKSFARWLREQRGRADPIGDLAADFREDRSARGIRSAGQLLSHMIRSHACFEARLALQAARREYRAIAAATELGVMTVGRARARIEATVPNGTVEPVKRIGRDGKSPPGLHLVQGGAA